MVEAPTLKKWNAIRWLGCARCLTALCEAYLFILNHLDDEIKTGTDKKVGVSINYYQFITNIEIVTSESPRFV